LGLTFFALSSLASLKSVEASNKLTLTSDSWRGTWAEGRFWDVCAWCHSCSVDSVPLRLDSQRARIETFVGRFLAMCAHPYATWRSQPTRSRVFVLLAYAVGSYGVVLAALFAIK